MRALFFVVAAFVVIADQLTKRAVAATFLPDESRIVIPHVVYLTYMHNFRGAFGLFGAHPLALAIAAAAIVALFYASYRQAGATTATHVAFGLILGGAIGNIIDRIHLHYVIDFIDLRWWPVFNLADSAITVGVAILFIRMLWHEQRTPATADQSRPPVDANPAVTPSSPE